MLEGFLQLAPIKIDSITRTAINGSWFNFFMCGVERLRRRARSPGPTAAPTGVPVPAGSGLTNGERGCS